MKKCLKIKGNDLKVTIFGFTLIELLAIIVILAIIAVITIPIILDVIDNSKRGAAIDSAYGFKEAIQKYYVVKFIENTEQELQSGYKFVSDLPSDFSVSGEHPTGDSWVKLNQGIVEEYSLKIGDYVVTNYTDGEVIAVRGGSVQENEEIRAERLAREAVISSANAYISALEELTPSITSQVKSVSNLNELVTLESEANAGWVVFDENGNITDYSLQFGDYIINYDMLIEKSSNIKDKPWIQTIFPTMEGEPINGVQYYAHYNPQVVYYDPINTVKCAAAVDDNDITGYRNSNTLEGYTGIIPEINTNNQTTCLKWRAYNQFEENGKTYVNMILDHNINTKYVEWISTDDYSNPPSNLGVSYNAEATFGNSRNTSKGPLTALKYLKNNLNHWNTSVIGNTYVSETPTSIYTINYSEYKARLITVEEVAIISGKTAEQLISSSGVPMWLNSIDPGITGYSGITGYWMSTASIDNNERAWAVYNATYANSNALTLTNRGIRPVITVPIEEIF